MFRRVLALSPHTDDCEFGCGGSLARLLAEGHEIFYAAFSSAEKSVPPELPKDILREEVEKATAVLGIPRSNLILFDYAVRDFPAHRQEILEDLIELRDKIEPDLVFLPSPNDTHQDHQVVASEGFRAFKKSTILGYEIPWNNLSFQTDCFIFLEERFVHLKISALKCYFSQLGRDYVNEDFIRSLVCTRGGQIGTKYAEAFNAIHWIWR